MRFTFTGNCLSNINFDLYTNDFTFYFGKIPLSCPVFIAEFISPNVSNLRKIDQTTMNYSININLKPKYNTINRLIKLIEGNPVYFSNSESDHELALILFSLGNKDIFDTNLLNNISEENVFDFINIKKLIGAPYQQEIEFCATNFEQLKNEISKENKIDFSDIENIIGSPKLLIRNEFSLLDFVKDCILIDPINIGLLKYVKSEYLSIEQRTEFLSSIGSIKTDNNKYFMEFIKNLSAPMQDLTYKRHYKYWEDFDGVHYSNGLFHYLSENNDDITVLYFSHKITHQFEFDSFQNYPPDKFDLDFQGNMFILHSIALSVRVVEHYRVGVSAKILSEGKLIDLHFSSQDIIKYSNSYGSCYMINKSPIVLYECEERIPCSKLMIQPMLFYSNPNSYPKWNSLIRIEIFGEIIKNQSIK